LLLLEGGLPFHESLGVGGRVELSFWLSLIADLSLFADYFNKACCRRFCSRTQLLCCCAAFSHFVLSEEWYH